MFSTFAGVLTDPIQKMLGFHQKRLEKAIAGLEAKLKGEEPKGYSSKAPLLARVLDVMDILSRAAAMG